ncbi:MAG TPA: hypothetical protein ENH90_01750 [bacterium]|nr:hypothetical protein [bacterium]
MVEVEVNEDEQQTKMEFMRKSRFDKIRHKFNNVSEDAQKVIDVAKSNEILRLALTFNSPVKVVEAEIFNEEKFVELAF